MRAGAHEDFVEFRQMAPPTNRKFGLTAGGFLVAVAGARLALSGPNGLAAVLLVAGVSLILFGAALPDFLDPARRAWMRLGSWLATALNPLMMLAMFAIVFVPVGLITRLFGRDILQHRPKPASESYWLECEPSSGSEQRLRDQF